ncbi:UNVERIFIED_CONTAM: hypothetical protein BEN50_06410 [Euhalothece sp. KZN 001]
MLSALRKTAQKVSANESNENMVHPNQSELNQQTEWKESTEDKIIAGSDYWENHQERYRFVKNRTHYPTRRKLQEANSTHPNQS